MRTFWMITSVAVAVAAVLLTAPDARAAALGDFSLATAEAPPTQAAAPAVHEPVSLGVAVTLAIVPGFGLGHYYADDDHTGLTFLVLDASIAAVFLGTFVVHLLSVAPAYTKVAVIVIPAIFGTVKAIEVYDVIDSVEVANNRTMKPSLNAAGRPAALRHVAETAEMVTVARF